MTPPRHESDTLRDDEKTPTRMRSPAEDSQVQEIEAMHVAHYEKIEALLDARFGTAQKVEETSAALLKLPKRLRWTRVAAGLLAAVGSCATGAYASTAGVAADYKADLEQQAVERHEAKRLELATASHLATPHQDPGAAAKLAEVLDGLSRRLDIIDARLERLETRRR